MCIYTICLLLTTFVYTYSTYTPLNKSEVAYGVPPDF